MQSVIGTIKLVIAPAVAETRKIMKFNITIIEMSGFAEREGTEVHAQMFIPGVSDEGGATTTTMISDFDEGPIRFNSTHGMSMPLRSSIRKACLRVAIFAKITPMHLEKLLSWDDCRDHSKITTRKKKTARLNEQEFYTEERHDVFARIQILELAENGDYLPVEVLQQYDTDQGAFQLHQGLQRRILISMTHSSGDALKWKNVYDVRVGSVRLLDPRGNTPDMSSETREVTLNIIQGPVLKNNSDGTATVTVIAQWDSSLHNSLLLDRATIDKYRIQICVRWNVSSDRLSEPILFSLDVASQIQPRLGRSPSKFMQLWSNTRTVHASVGLFQLVVRPAAARRAGDLWRMNTVHKYVKGEEYLDNWVPRGVSLVRDFIDAKRKRLRMSEVENAKGFLNSLPNTRSVTPVPSSISTRGPRRNRSRTPTPQLQRTLTPQPSRDPGTPVPEGRRVRAAVVQPADIPLPADGEDEHELLDQDLHPLSGTTSGPEKNSTHPRDPQNVEVSEPLNGIIEDSPLPPLPLGLQSFSVEDVAPPESVISIEDAKSQVESIRSEDEELAVLRKFVKLWKQPRDPSEMILVEKNTEPPHNGTSFVESEAKPPRLIAEVRHATKKLVFSYILHVPNDF